MSLKTFFRNLIVKKLDVIDSFSIAGTQVTATAAELNAIAGGGLSSTELGYLDGVAAGTATASKALVVGANKNVDTLVVADGGLKLGSGAGTAITATADDLNVWAGYNNTGTFRYRITLVKTGNYTLTVADSGGTIIANVADLVLTLPTNVAGVHYRIVLGNSGLSTGTGLQIAPASGDKFIGNGFTPQADKKAILAGASDRIGDSISLVADGSGNWMITSVTGTWSREA